METKLLNLRNRTQELYFEQAICSITDDVIGFVTWHILIKMSYYS